MGNFAPERIRYLALEGGGGVGNAFPGALRALRRLGVLEYQMGRPNHVKSFSGASAGAITAMFLACGFEPEEISRILEIEDFATFFDPVQPGRIPAVTGFRSVPRGSDSGFGSPVLFGLPLRDWLMEELVVAIVGEDARPPLHAAIVANTGDVRRSLTLDYGVFVGEPVIAFLRKWLLLARLRVLRPDVMSINTSVKLDEVLTKEPAPKSTEADQALPLPWDTDPNDDKRAEQLKHRIDNLHALWASLTNRGAIASYLGFDPGSANDPKLPSTTFLELQRSFGTELIVTGSELESKKTQLFSPRSTPDFPVEDAVRISMSLPLIFKPYVTNWSDATRFRLRSHLESRPRPDDIYPKDRTAKLEVSRREDLLARNCPGWFRGVFVDGGYFNNCPTQVFTSENGPVSGRSPEVLGLRLTTEEEDRATAAIGSFPGLLRQYLIQAGTFGGGESQISQTLGTLQRTISLPKGKLGLLSFKPPPADLAEADATAERTVKQAFAEPPSRDESQPASALQRLVEQPRRIP